MRLEAEVVGRFDEAGDCDRLLYAPLDRKRTFRRTRRYALEFSGDAGAAEAFLRRVLADEVSQEFHVGGAPALEGDLFHLDFGMKRGALDLEKETILRYFRELEDPGFSIGALEITQRVYVFGDSEGDGLSSDRFVRDIVNPAIHRWNVVDRRSCA